MPVKSLKSRANSLANPKNQLDFLSNGIFKDGNLVPFEQKILATQKSPLKTKSLEILQLNLGYMCNQTCAHCHVDAGPDRKEIMSRETLKDCLAVLDQNNIRTLDLTGGAPEMNPHFRWFIQEARKTKVKDIIVRSNLTILLANKKFYDLPEFFAQHQLHVVSSLPFYRKEKTDRQRGNGVFDRSIEALKKLNAVGYGVPESKLQLDLVYNPAGAFLPGNQKQLELDFKKSLKQDFNIVFNQLFTITNLPISRFLEYLIASENYEDYMHELVSAFNPKALDQVMCTHTLSVGWDGLLYDCDFNQMLSLKIQGDIQHIKDVNPQKLEDRCIRVSQHCYGCTAGSGSSCQGALEI